MPREKIITKLQSTHTGFTLVEMLVVVSIIAVLAIVATLFYRSSQNAALDARRKGDINTIASAYEANFDQAAREYQVLQATDFRDQSIPVPPEGGGYNGIINSPANAFRVCAALSSSEEATCNIPSDSCFCVTSQRGTYTPPTGGGAIGWIPVLGTTWQIVLPDSLSPADIATSGQAFTADWENNTKTSIDQLHAAGKMAICYVSVGTYEDWRSDAASFPASVKGNSTGYSGERYLDIRQVASLEPIMKARFDTCKDKGFDAVMPDNVDGWENSTGFPISAADQITYNSAIADWVHEKGMSVALSNDREQISDLVGKFDFAISSECFQWDECNNLQQFISAGKPVFEYELTSKYSEAQFTANVCSKPLATQFNTILKKSSLDSYRFQCP